MAASRLLRLPRLLCFGAAAHADVAWAVDVRMSAGCGAKKLMEEAGVKA